MNFIPARLQSLPARMIPVMSDTPTPSADSHTSADLQTAVNAANVQIAATEKRLADTQAAHRAATFQALTTGGEAPTPPKELATLGDHRAALIGTRDYLAGERDKAKVYEDQARRAKCLEKAAEITEEYNRRLQLAWALLREAYDRFAQVSGHLPEEGLVRRDLRHHVDHCDRTAANAEIAALGLGSGHTLSRVDVTGNRELATLVRNTVNGLFA